MLLKGHRHGTLLILYLEEKVVVKNCYFYTKICWREWNKDEVLNDNSFLEMTQVCTTSWFFRGSQMHESPVCSHDFESRELEVSLFKIRTPCCAIVGFGELGSLILHKGMFLTSQQIGEGWNGVKTFFKNVLCFSNFSCMFLRYKKPPGTS